MYFFRKLSMAIAAALLIGALSLGSAFAQEATPLPSPTPIPVDEQGSIAGLLVGIGVLVFIIIVGVWVGSRNSERSQELTGNG